MASEGDRPDRLTLWQRSNLRRMRKASRKRKGEPLTPEDWETYYQLMTGRSGRLWMGLLRSLPSSPRCGICGAPFAGFGSRLVKPLGYRPSRKNPTYCDTCIEASPPGGMKTEVGVLFADLRGFTRLSEQSDPEAVSALLRRFYACAERVLFPEEIIDKLIGDEVMALYLPMYGKLEDAAMTMLAHSRELLAQVGYGSPEGPFVEVGIGLDYGEAFVGNVGERSLYDFTAIGDVVNVASRLQGEAKGGEIVASGRLIAQLRAPVGERVEVSLKGRAEPVTAYRVTADAPAAAPSGPG
ncbi:MAG TPA: adenylate/guanylate cyclase domain-containing protein [Solirubrobacterales bacterium]|nr:adenylate/guanylate cyclase domain-containing protein [Solirubrobacterales bacterium]